MTLGIRLAPGADAELVTPQLPAHPGPRILLLPLPGSPASRSVMVKLEKSLVMWVSSVMALTTSEAVTRTMEAVLGARGRRVWSQVWRLQTFWFLGHLTSENVNHYSFKRSKITQRNNGKDNR